jgi:hypothetical protein
LHLLLLLVLRPWQRRLWRQPWLGGLKEGAVNDAGCACWGAAVHGCSLPLCSDNLHHQGRCLADANCNATHWRLRWQPWWPWWLRLLLRLLLLRPQWWPC